MKSTLCIALTFFILFGSSAALHLKLNFVEDMAALDKSISCIEFTTWNCFDEKELLQLKSGTQWSFRHQRALPLPSTDLKPTMVHRTLHFVDLRCEEAREHFSHINSTFFQHPYRWLVVVDKDDNDDATSLSYFNRFQLLQANNVIVAVVPKLLVDNGATRQELVIELKQVYKIREFRPIQVEEFGWWSNISGFHDRRSSKILGRRRMNFMGEELIASHVFLNNKTYSLVYNQHEVQVDRPFRVVFNQMNALSM